MTQGHFEDNSEVSEVARQAGNQLPSTTLSSTCGCELRGRWPQSKVDALPFQNTFFSRAPKVPVSEVFNVLSTLITRSMTKT